MKLGLCEAWNFGSYPYLSLDFSSPGLALIHGKTGSGKSMLADLACWVLFGVTAKDGNADEVKSWLSPNDPTKGVLDVQLLEGSITVTRIRGKSGQNDLYWTEGSSDKKERGKDITETQRRICARLRVDSSLYLAASYFCDFSSSGRFFLDKPKDRREMFEKVASLEFPIKLAGRLADSRKKSKKDGESANITLAMSTGKLEQISASLQDIETRYADWEHNKNDRLASIAKSLKTARDRAAATVATVSKLEFIKEELRELQSLKPEVNKARSKYQENASILRSLTDEQDRLFNLTSYSCPVCLSPQVSNSHRKSRLKELNKLIKVAATDSELSESILDRLIDKVEKIEPLQKEAIKLERDLSDRKRALMQAEKDYAAADQSNPFTDTVYSLEAEHNIVRSNVKDLADKVSSLEERLSSLELLHDLSFELRRELLRKAVRDIESSTNAYLEKYFDAEIRVYFSVEDSDSLEVSIQKSGFQCTFKQMSKGQRQLLKLCFAVSVMEAAANASGIHFSNLFFDEALDGLDDDLKVKAFGLFSELETRHDSIMLIDHAPAFQNLFSKRYHVTMESDASKIELEYE